MDSIEIRKGKRSIDEVLSRHRVQRLDTERTFQALDNRFADVMKDYEAYLGRRTSQVLIPHQLEPKDISTVLRATARYEEHIEYEWQTGRFISQLLINSLKAGHSRFELDLRGLKPLDMLATNIVGRETESFYLDVTGDVGAYFAAGIYHGVLNLVGNAANDFGKSAMCSQLTIHGHAGQLFGNDGLSTDYTIYGTLGEGCASLAHNCKFITPNRRTAKILEMQVPRLAESGRNSGNKVVLMHEDGNEEVIVDYGCER